MSATRQKNCGKLLSLEHDRPKDFAESEWQGNSTLLKWTYLVYRWLLALFLLISLVLNIVEIRTLRWPGPLVRRAKWFIYLTNWAFTLLTTQALLAAVIATRHVMGRQDSAMTTLHKTYWTCNNLANDLAPGITFGYWTLVYNPEIHVFDFDNIVVHMINSITILIDICICGHPIKLLHIYQPIMLGATYSIFTGFYYLAGGTNQVNDPKIYPLLDWGKPQWAILVCIGFCVVLATTHFLCWILVLIRSKLKCCLLGDKYKIKNSQLSLNNIDQVNEVSTRNHGAVDLELIFVALLFLLLKPLNNFR